MQTEQPKNSNVLSWLCRDYESCEKRKALARTFYLSTVKHPGGDGNSDNARNNLAEFLQSQFTEFQAKDITVDRWSKGFTAIEKVEVPAPTLNETVNWNYIADYFLLAASVPWQEFDEMNEARQRWNQAYRDRIATNKERLQRHSTFDKKVLDSVVAEGIDVFQYGKIMERIQKSMLDEDKKHWQEDKNLQEKIDKRSYTELQKTLYSNEPIPLREQDKGIDGFFLTAVSLYQTKYFNTPKEESDNRRSMDKQENLWTS
jgi:hypothetical protein